MEEVWKTFHESLEKKGRALLSFQINVLNDDDVVVTYAIYEWFVTKNREFTSHRKHPQVTALPYLTLKASAK